MNPRALLLLLAALSASLSAQTPPPYSAAIVMEPSTAKVVFEHNAHQPAPTASMTKMMTLVLVLDAIGEGTIGWDTPVTVSARASKMGGSQVYLKHGETFPVRDLVAATMVHSANDAAMALAERIGGTSEAFVKMMNRRAQQLGLKNTRYFSPHGLPGEGEPDDQMSPYDLAILGRELMRDATMRQLAVTQQMPFRGGEFIMYNPNHLLKMYPGAIGIKTGFHAQAGFCVTAAAQRGDMEMIAVVMGSERKNDNFQSAADLLSDAFNTYKIIEPVRQGQRLDQTVPVQRGAARAVPVAAGEPGRVLLKRGESEQVEVELAGNNAIAPIRQGQQVGWIMLKQNGQVLSRVPAVAAISVDEAPWWKKLMVRLWPF